MMLKIPWALLSFIGVPEVVYQIFIVNGLPGPGLVLNAELSFALAVYQKTIPLVACQVQALGNLEPGSVEVHVSNQRVAIDSKGWHVSLFSGQPGDCFPKGRSRCFSYVSTVPFFLQSGSLVSCPLVKST
jgi:hypothetical protein